MRAIAAIFPLLASFGVAANEVVSLRFKPRIPPATAEVMGRDLLQITPADSMCGKMVSSLKLVVEASPGRIQIVDRVQILATLDPVVESGCMIRWEGPGYVAIHRLGQPIDIGPTRQSVADALSVALSARYRKVEVKALDQRDLTIEGTNPAHFEYSIPSDLKPQKRTMIVARLVEPNGTSRSYPLWFSVTAYDDVLMLARDLAAADAIEVDSYQVANIDVAATQGDTLPVDTDFTTLVAKLPIAAGTVLRKSQFVTRPEIEVGDRVALRVRHGEVSIEATAVALQSARAGQRVLVRAPLGAEVITARALSRGVAEVLP